MMGFLILFVFFIVGFSNLVENSIFAYKSMSAKNWPTTMGKIESLSLQTKTLESQCPTTHHTVKVTYNYYLHNEMYIGSQIAFGYYGGDNLGYQEALMEKLRSSSTVIVRYNSKDPKISTLSFGVHHSIKKDFLFSAWLILVFFMFCLVSVFSIAFYGFAVIFCIPFILLLLLNFYIDNTLIQNIMNSSDY